ncbi:cation:proton antiporter [Candidatus Woesearchaeota archaeon]|nr:cation:proton antiporter [Candidatus Woesearchaeota archaeon]
MEFDLVTLGILFVFALFGGIISAKTKQPLVIGLLVVGALIGPSLLNLVNSPELTDFMIEMGAILLLFITGLEFEVSKLFKIGIKAIITTLLKVGIVFFLGFLVTVMLGYSTGVGIFIGVIISFSSTVVILKVLQEKQMIERNEIPFLVAVLIIEDIIAVAFLTFFYALQNNSSGINVASVVNNIVVSIIILIIVYAVCLRIIKPIIAWVLKNTAEDTIIFIDLGIMVGFSYLAYYLNLSTALGAFLAGSLVASLPNAKLFEKTITPFTLMFSSLFFISIGTLIDFRAIIENWLLVIVLLVVTVISRFIGIGLITNIFANFQKEQIFFSSIAMFSVGEFALLVARESRGFNLGVDLVSISSVVIFVSALLMSLAIRKYTQSYEFVKAATPWRLRKINMKMESISNFIHLAFQEIDTENAHTIRLKKSTITALLSIINVIFVHYFWTKIAYTLHGTEYYAAFGMFLLIEIILIYLLYVHTRIAIRTLLIVFVNMNLRGTLKKSKHLLWHLFLFFVFSISALYSPLLLFLFDLQLKLLIIPGLFILLSIFLLIKIIKEIHSGFTYTGVTNYAHFQRLKSRNF